MDIENAILLADCNHGIYCPQAAIKSLDPEKVTFKNARHIDILIVKAGPELDNSDYWQAWHDIETMAQVIDKETGKEYQFYQDGDIWLVPCDS